ncbi:MAG: hypothetical protein E7256_05165 [Lachnospiraceae bacterium]|nr:hypothetical protein [Lachnospiraceae bacterium]
MVCKVCGRTMTNENANFCEYCGASFRGDVDTSFLNETKIPENAYNSQAGQMSGAGQKPWGSPVQNVMAAQKQSVEESISFGKWLLVMVLPFIPIVGFWAFVVLLFIWGFGKNTSQTKKNWARATLVIGTFVIVLMMALMGQMLTDPAFASLFEGLI